MKTLDAASNNVVLTITDIRFLDLRPTRLLENLEQEPVVSIEFQFQNSILPTNVRKIDLKKSALDDSILGVLLRFAPVDLLRGQ